VSDRVVLAGLPATGKTSYLALLFHAIVEERADGLSLGRFDDDREHITEVSDVLLASRVADHTTMNDEQDVTLSLKYQEVDFVLDVPDLSGETWEHALVDRRWPASLDEDVADATGFLVFVHCQEINDGLTIVEAEQATAAIVGDDDAPIDEPGTVIADTDASDGDLDDGDLDDGDLDDGDLDNDDLDDNDLDQDDEEQKCKQLTQVSLVELIQFFAAVSPRPIRVGIVISAWDLEPKSLKPKLWLTKNVPMLAQFLQANGDEVEAAVWGVSAQGADLSDEVVRESYRDKDPIDRARVVAADGAHVGVAAPLLWVLRPGQ
jgi:Double-GTPase 1